jgi:hypothetical protein
MTSKSSQQIFKYPYPSSASLLFITLFLEESIIILDIFDAAKLDDILIP